MNAVTKLVRVKWHDASSRAGWFKAEDIEAFETELVMIDSVGWLLSENDDVLIMAASKMATSAGDLLIIPKGMIKERWEL